MLLASPRKPMTVLSTSIRRERICPASMSKRTVPAFSYLQDLGLDGRVLQRRRKLRRHRNRRYAGLHVLQLEGLDRLEATRRAVGERHVEVVQARPASADGHGPLRKLDRDFTLAGHGRLDEVLFPFQELALDVRS